MDVVNFIFTGLKHSGKTTHGRLFAENRGLTFYDLDTLIEDDYAAGSGSRLGCREIYIKHGGSYFRDLENRVVNTFLSSCTDEPFVLALGGGVIETPAALLESCSARAILVYLKLPVEVLIGRIFAGGIPPFLDEDDPEQAFRERYAKKSVLLEKYADCIIEIPDLDRNQTQELVAGRLEEYR